MSTSAASSTTAAEAVCDYCALPLRRHPVELAIDGDRKHFCCYGCGLAMQVTDARGEEGEAATILVRLGLAIFFAMNVMMMSLPAYAPHVYGSDASTDGALFSVLRVLAMIFAAPVIVLLGVPILRSAIGNLRSGNFATDTLIVVGVVAATAISSFRVFFGGGPVFFDTAAMVLVLVTLGRYLEARARARAGATIRRQVDPGETLAHRLSPQAGDVTIDALIAGDRVRVMPGEMFPADGKVLEGEGWVDEAVLTGESTPLLKQPEAKVAGGTCSVDGRFDVLIERPADQSASARIADLLAEASREPSSVERASERVARFFLPATLAIAAATSVWWGIDSGIDRAVLSGLSVLVVACPCALGLATPMAMWLGLGEAARRGIVVRRSETLEQAAAVDFVYFDKTGTLTTATPRLQAAVPRSERGLSADQLIADAALLERDLPHPLARAIAGAAEERGISHHHRTVTDLRILAGRGVTGRVDGKPLTVGSPAFAAEHFPQQVGRSDESGVTYVWDEDSLLGELRFAESVRDSAADLIASLRQRGNGVRVLSGDRSARAICPHPVAEDEILLGLTPDEKLDHIRAGREQRRAGGGAVAFVGDGLNDAPALAAADVGVAFGTPADLTKLNADAVVLTGDLMRIDWLLEHAARLRRVIRQNLAWAFGYNTIALVAAAAGWLTPMIASILMLLSSGFVVANSRRVTSRGASAPASADSLSDTSSLREAPISPPA